MHKHGSMVVFEAFYYGDLDLGPLNMAIHHPYSPKGKSCKFEAFRYVSLINDIYKSPKSHYSFSIKKISTLIDCSQSTFIQGRHLPQHKRLWLLVIVIITIFLELDFKKALDSVDYIGLSFCLHFVHVTFMISGCFRFHSTYPPLLKGIIPPFWCLLMVLLRAY